MAMVVPQIKIILKQMKYNQLSKILIFIFSFCFLANTGLALGAGLSVQFEQTPLFNEVSVMPGNTATRFIKVTNTSGETKNVVIEAINKNDPDLFSEKLSFEIKRGSDVVFDGTLKQFFTAGEMVLSSIDNNTTAQYDVTFLFDKDAGNSYQNATVGFDLLVGFQGEEGGSTDNPGDDGDGDNGGGGTSGGGGGSTSGGGGGTPPGLTIYSENSTCLCTEGSDKVEIVWQTNYLSTSAVIYDLLPNQFVFSEGEPTYGYAYYKSGDDSGVEKVTSHKVSLTGLVPNQTYYYRVVSHASPATISREGTFVFTTACIRETGQDDENQPPTEVAIASNNSFGQGGSEGGQGTGGIGGRTEGDMGGEENGLGQEQAANNSVAGLNFNDAMANLSSILANFLKNLNLSPCFYYNLLIILAIIIAIIGYACWKKGKEKDGKNKDSIRCAYLLWIVASLVFILWAYLIWIHNCCFVNILIILAIIIAFIGYRYWKKGKEINDQNLIRYAYFLWIVAGLIFILWIYLILIYNSCSLSGYIFGPRV